jgi:hypothetical protein
MFRSYLASAFIAFGLYGFAQVKGWSIFPTEAQQFQRERAEAQESRRYGSSGRGGGFSGK